MLDLKRLMVFYEVGRQSSFSDAAHVLSYSQPAISHHVLRLEQELGVRLFERSSRGDVRLTEAGKLLQMYAENLLTTASNAEAAIAELVGNRETRVRVGAFATGAASILTDALARLNTQMIGVQLNFTEAETPESVAGLKTRNLDLALIFDDAHHPVAPEDDLEYHYLYDDPMLLALPRGHRLAAKPVIGLAELANESWIEGAGNDTPCSLILSSACTLAGFEPTVVLNSGNYEIVQRLAGKGIGVAIIPELALTSPDPGIVVRRLEPEPWRRVVLALHKTAYRSTAVKVLVDAIVQTCQQYASTRDERVRSIAAA
jgi:DNA-binding transcriptional LysR family regulator